MLFSTVAERAQRAATSENMQIEKAPTNQKTSVWTPVQMLTMLLFAAHFFV